MTFTLSIDVGGSGIKAMVLNEQCEPVSERSRRETPYPCSPELFLQMVSELVADQPFFERVSVGFPAIVRNGHIYRASAYARAVRSGPRDPELFALWNGYPLQDRISELVNAPTLVINDADMQGCAVVTGVGMEFVVTLGTGVGTGVFYNGHLLPHMELSHGSFAGTNIDIALGDAQRKVIGNKEWRPLVTKALIDFDAMFFPDKMFIGGGNAKRLREEDLIPGCEIVPNTAGLVGGVRAWEFVT